MMPQPNIATYAFSHPRFNFGGIWKERTAEDEFATEFASTYNRKFAEVHGGSARANRCMAYEIPVNGLGIADLVALSWDDGIAEPHSAPDNCKFPDISLTVRAFETKLTDWKRGLMQAHRYKYFADVSILVMPAAKKMLIAARIPMFQALGVGVWTYNSDSQAITKLYTPRPKHPASHKHRSLAVSAVCKAITQDQPTP